MRRLNGWRWSAPYALTSTIPPVDAILSLTHAGKGIVTVTEARPRWATFSVKSHLDLDALTLDVLLYEALVSPTPYDKEEVKRWDKEGWDPTKLALRITQLGDLAAVLPGHARSGSRAARANERARFAELGLGAPPDARASRWSRRCSSGSEDLSSPHWDTVGNDGLWDDTREGVVRWVT